MKNKGSEWYWGWLEMLEIHDVRVSFEHSNHTGGIRIALWVPTNDPKKPSWNKDRIGHIPSYDTMKEALVAAFELSMQHRGRWGGKTKKNED